MMTAKHKELPPVVKWSGSKKKIAPLIKKLFPPASHYYEPFVGSGALLPYRPCPTGVAGDVIVELIDLWNVIKQDPEVVSKEYECRWKQRQQEGHTAYYKVRDDFNRTRNPHDLLFLSRTCVNGLIRFNKDGDFNNSLHHTRPGIAPDTLKKIIFEWSYNIQGIEFLAADYRETLQTVSSGDLVFLDPPYAGTKGRYMPEAFGLDCFYLELERLNRVGAKWILTFDGRAGQRTYDNTPVPRDLYSHQIEMQTGNSPFTKLMNTSLDAVVESVYLNFEPVSKTLSKASDFVQQELSL